MGLAGFYSVIAILGLATAASGSSLTLADSVADFSGTQGENGWNYGYFVDSATTFTTTGFTYGQTLSPYWGFGNDALTTFALLGEFQAHPGVDMAGPTNYTPVRQWTNSSYSGSVTVNGSIYKADTSAPADQTVVAGIYKNGNLIFTDILAGDNSFGAINYSFATSLEVGDTIDLALKTLDNMNANDLTVFTGTLTADEQLSATPEPASFILGGSLLGFSLFLHRRR